MTDAKVNDSTISSSSQFRPTLRLDLQWVHYHSQSQWVAHDPIAGSYFRLNEFEYFAARLMNGVRSLSDIVRDANLKFAGRAINLTWLTGLVQRLQTGFLLQPTQQTTRWIASHSKSRKPGLFGQLLLNPLTIRIPLFDPGSLLKHFRWLAYLLFSRLSVAVVFLTATICTVLVLRSLAQHASAFSIDPSRITADRWLLLFGCFIAAKSLHEFGHMLACARYGVRSAEVGLLFLCLTPCFYCETTDTWKLPSRWQRAMIAAAGIYVEIILAILGASVWLATREGTVHLIAFNVMMICSLSTVLVNANPLFRFDGYFILSDLWQIPNLHDQSRAAASLLLQKYILLRRNVRFDLDGNPWLLAAFAIASAIYRVTMLFGILWFSWSFLPATGFGLLAIFATGSIATGIAMTYWRKASSTFRDFKAMRVSQKIWSVIVLSVIIGVSITILCWPIDKRVNARAIIDFEDKQPIYVSYDSKITFLAAPNRICKAGSDLMRLDSPDAQLELLKVEGTRDRVANELKQLRVTAGSLPESGYSIPTLEKQLTTLNARHAVLTKEVDQLVVRAPEDGYLIDAQSSKAKSLTLVRDDRFNSSLCAKENVNSWARRSELIGYFSARRHPVAIALVPEHELGQLNLGMQTIIRTDSESGRDLHGTITRIATDSISKLPDSLLGDESLPSKQSDHGNFETEIPHYEVTIAIDDSSRPLFRSVATVSIRLQKAALYQHIIDYVRHSLKPLTL